METGVDKFWVGVLKGQWENHEVFASKGEPEPTDYPQYDYVVGPFETKPDADKRAAREKNQEGMFRELPGTSR